MDEYKRVALHYAVSRKLPVTFIRELLSVYPEGAGCRDHDNQLPLHLAYKRNVDIEVIKLLVEAYPEGIVSSDNFNFLPIHYAIELNVSVEKIQFIIDRNPLCLQFRSNDKLALHMAIEFKRSLEVISAIGNGFPEGAKDREHKKVNLIFFKGIRLFILNSTYRNT